MRAGGVEPLPPHPPEAVGPGRFGVVGGLGGGGGGVEAAPGWPLGWAGASPPRLPAENQPPAGGGSVGAGLHPVPSTPGVSSGAQGRGAGEFGAAP